MELRSQRLRSAWLPTHAFTLLFVSGVSTAAPPNAGSILENLNAAPALPSAGTGALPEEPMRPPLRRDAAVAIRVTAIRITGVHAFPNEELAALVADAAGRTLTLADLDEYAERISRHYRDAGYLLARAYLPAQDIIDGMVEIAVIEGRLGKLHIENDSSMPDAEVAARFAAVKGDAALDGLALERSLLLLNDLPNVEVKSTLKPGASVGTTDLDVRVDAKSPYAGSVEFDNFGNRFSGDLRLGASFSAGNLAGLSDTLALRGVEAAGLSYGRAAWQVPVGSAGTQAGAAWSSMRYRLGHDFASLEAHGTADIGSLYALHPFVRSRASNVTGQIDYDRKRLVDDVDLLGISARKTFDVLTTGLSGDHIDGFGGGGLVSWSVVYTAGRLDLDAGSKALDAAGHRTQGGYDKLSLSVSRQQSLGDDWALAARVQAQAAGKNLDSAEKVSLGGAYGVRAYPQGEAPADDAWLASLELRHAFAPGWQTSLFHDAAAGRLNHSPIPADGVNRRRLSGIGLGLTYMRPARLLLQLGLAWRNTAAPDSDVDRGPRAWLQAIQRF
ncbi:MAG TPA: ShlB/FhaC/HecB family hemolysin secretion/activation protein [Rhodocyclaceae bacterium]